MHRLRPFLFSLAVPFLLFHCSGVFVNPDLAGGQSLPFASYHRIALPTLSLKEERVYREIKDTGFVRIPDHDFYWMQDNFLNLISRFYKPALSVKAYVDTVGEKNITRRLLFDSPYLRPLPLLQEVTRAGFCVYTLDSCPAKLLTIYLRHEIPVLIFGTLTYKKRFYRVRAGVVDTLPEKTLPNKLQKSVFRKINTFDIIYGYIRERGPFQHLPGEEMERYHFDLRSQLKVKSAASKNLINRASSLVGGRPVGSHWLIQAIFIVLPKERSVDDLQKTLAVLAKKMQYTEALPPLKKVL